MFATKGYRVKVNLSYIFQDHQCTYGIRNFYLMIEKKKYFYLNPQEDVRVIQPNNTIIVVPINTTFNESIHKEQTEYQGMTSKQTWKYIKENTNIKKKRCKENTIEKQHIADLSVMNDIDSSNNILFSNIETISNNNNGGLHFPMDVEDNIHNSEMNNNFIVKEILSLTDKAEVHMDRNETIHISESSQDNDNCTSTNTDIKFYLMSNVTPGKNDFVIFQILKFGMDHTPNFSKLILGKVLHYNENTHEVQVYISEGMECLEREGLTLNENPNQI